MYKCTSQQKKIQVLVLFASFISCKLLNEESPPAKAQNMGLHYERVYITEHPKSNSFTKSNAFITMQVNYLHLCVSNQ